MKLSEITAHNKANLERCTVRQAIFMRESVLYLDCGCTKYLFFSKCRFDKYVRKAGHYELVTQPVPKYMSVDVFISLVLIIVIVCEIG